MKYDGLIISDCLEMDGVRATFGTEKGAVMALEVCHPFQSWRAMLTKTPDRQEQIV